MGTGRAVESETAWFPPLALPKGVGGLRAGALAPCAPRDPPPGNRNRLPSQEPQGSRPRVAVGPTTLRTRRPPHRKSEGRSSVSETPAASRLRAAATRSRAAGPAAAASTLRDREGFADDLSVAEGGRRPRRHEAPRRGAGCPSPGERRQDTPVGPATESKLAGDPTDRRGPGERFLESTQPNLRQLCQSTRCHRPLWFRT